MVREVTLPAEKQKIARTILADLPDWFGIPESTAAYVADCGKYTLLADFEQDEAVGFAALKPTSPQTAELYVMGVKKALHRQGIGARLFEALRARAKEEGYRFLQVKTVAAGCYPEYDRTRLFYEAMGFSALEVFPTLWDEHNPCLVMVMAL